MSMLRRVVNLSRQLSAEYARIDTLRAAQLDKLQRLVSEAYRHVEAYRCLMQRNGVRPEDIRSLDDIARLPVVRKQDLLAFSEQERTHQIRTARMTTERIATSGSSGSPFEFLVDDAGNDWRKAQYLRPYVTNGRRPWHRVLRLTAVSATASAQRVRLGIFGETRISCVAPLKHQLDQLRALRPVIVQGYPSALRGLAFEIERCGVDTSAVRLVFSDSELLTPDTRVLVERAFGAPLLDVFGSFETDNIAYQCIERRGYHCALDSAMIEICRDDEPVSAGDGDLVVTVLNNLATPFIRYNLEDVVSLRSSSCPCGRVFPTLDVVAGRRDDLVAVEPGGWRSPLSFLWRFDSFSDHIREYQVRQTGIDRFVVKVVPQGELTESGRSAIRQAMLEDFPEARVTVEAVDSLVRTDAGKLKAFVCDVPAERHHCDGN